jgi:hypothetical protein
MLMMQNAFAQSAPQQTLTEKDQLGQTLLLDRTDPSFGHRVQVGTARRSSYRLHSNRLQNLVKPHAELGIPVMRFFSKSQAVILQFHSRVRVHY